MKLRKLAHISTSKEEEGVEEMSMELEEGEILPPEEEEEEASQEDPKPVGKRVRFSGEGSEKKSHYKVFEFSGNRYTIEDPVLLAPETKEQKPDIIIIKDITQTIDGMVMVTGQLFYHPEDAKKKGGGNWQIRDTRELLYSTHLVEVPANCVMHKHCEGPVVLFLVAGEEESSRTERMKQMIVFKVQMACGKSRVKARTVVAKTCGVNFLELQGDDVIVVAGDGIDAACLTYSLRKKVGHTDIICMTPLE
ncbi:BROMO-ADJACENT HOMOLOGY (BAH) DOMAIN-CONTAINING PROTEIN [Salix viminalis]|uniref:BROMO-ADJACENT HOMOLOGY (BAH) DOMAIN-CONTAINING PROTEIN n=1 Tax=Salix viminalis TaxID=40686 RepID=A0A9Q0T7Q2_SALVM|nr:BROMO-ADJACENT HOMOLOGY (BAH) DOMAIN-CONTAINING PROTEIN [Salix viminalis]